MKLSLLALGIVLAVMSIVVGLFPTSWAYAASIGFFGFALFVLIASLSQWALPAGNKIPVTLRHKGGVPAYKNAWRIGTGIYDYEYVKVDMSEWEIVSDTPRVILTWIVIWSIVILTGYAFRESLIPLLRMVVPL